MKRRKIFYKSLGKTEEWPEGTIITPLQYNTLKKTKSGLHRTALFEKVKLIICDYPTPYWNDIEKFYYDYLKP